MNWIKIILISIIGLNTLATISSIGSERKPITPLMGTTVVFTNALMILAIIYA